MSCVRGYIQTFHEIVKNVMLPRCCQPDASVTFLEPRSRNSFDQCKHIGLRGLQDPAACLRFSVVTSMHPGIVKDTVFLVVCFDSKVCWTTCLILGSGEKEPFPQGINDKVRLQCVCSAQR